MLNSDFRYAEQFLVALVLTSLTVFIHSMGMSWVWRYRKRFHSFVKDGKPLKKDRVLMPGLVAIMMGAHFIEVLIWAWFYLLLGILPDLVSAIYFSIYSYTTLGSSIVTLPDHWRGLGDLRQWQRC